MRMHICFFSRSPPREVLNLVLAMLQASVYAAHMAATQFWPTRLSNSGVIHASVGGVSVCAAVRILLSLSLSLSLSLYIYIYICIHVLLQQKLFPIACRT